MANGRNLLDHIALDSAGNVLGGQSVTVYEQDGITPLAQTIYAASTGASTRSNPLTSDTLGRVIAYAATPQRVKLSVNGVLYNSEFRPDPVDLVLSSGATLSLATIADTLTFTENASALSDPGAGLAILRVGADGNLYIFPTGGSELKFLKSGLVVNADCAAGMALALTKLAPGAANTALLTNAGASAVVAALIANANIDPVAAIALSKLAAGSAGLLRSDGSAITAGHADVVNADCAAGMALLVSKLAAGGTANRVVATVDGTTMALQQVISSMLAANAVTQIGIAVGSTSGPTTTSTSYADLPEMSVTLTTTGGDLLCFFVGTNQNNTGGLGSTTALSLDAATEVGDAGGAAGGVNYNFVVANIWRFTGVSAASHTVKDRWKVNGGTGTATGTQRVLIVVEVKK